MPSGLINPFIAVAALLLFWLPAPTAAVRVSLLTESAALRDTLDILRASGCGEDAIDSFQRAVERYASTLFDFDLSKFPQPRDGFFTFESASGLVRALPHQLCHTQHAYEFNCFDTVVALAGGSLRTSVRPDDVIGPYLVPYTPTNGSFTMLPRATARDAFTLAYPPWYRDTTATALPKDLWDARISLTAALFRCHMLPQFTTEERLRDGVIDALQSSWREQDLKFPSRFEVVLCHEVSLPQRWFITAHAGLLFRRERGYMYIEKGGGSGPFVRLDFNDMTDLLTWLGGMFRSAERLGYTHHFVTFNDAKIEALEVPKE